MNLANSIIPKSNQLNADDLITGPRTVKITAVEQGDSDEQPVTISYEGDNGHPYKPGKSMRRVLVLLWGADGAAYVGRRLTLFREPNIRFGADQVGGIRISHASDITQPMQVALTESRGKRKPFRVDVLPAEQAPEPARDLQTLTDIADAKIAEGELTFTTWATALPSAEKRIIGGKLFAEWKTRAAR
jgi:hypothetical protein